MFRRWRRWLLIGVALVLVLLSAPVVWQLYARWEAQRELDAMIAELDQTDPRWRLDDVEADRRQVAPEANSARIAMAAHDLLPKKWNAADQAWLADTPAVFALRPAEARKLADDLNRAHAALAKARALENYPIGRHRLEYTPDFIGTLIPDQQNVRKIATLLERDVNDALQRRDTTRAWRSQRALLNCGRSLGDEPLLISPLIRIAIDSIAVAGLERTLAQGDMAPAQLEERQHALQDESTVALFLPGIRGERAGMNHLFTNFETGKINWITMLESAGKGNATDAGPWWHGIAAFFTYSMVLRSHATVLDFQTRMVKASQLPPTERYKALAEIDDAIRDEVGPYYSKALARLYLPAIVKVAQAEQRLYTQIACAVAGVAAERHRQTTGHWPASLDELVRAGMLPKVPTDLYDGQPLRFRRTSDGLVIYSVGRDGVYDGTALDMPDTYDPMRVRVEFRLWDPMCRRQQPSAIAKSKGPLGEEFKLPPPDDSYVQPRGYLCYRAATPIKLDGKLDDAAWQAAPWTEDFVDIEGDRRQRPRLRTRAKMLWDDQCFYIGAEIQEPHVQASFTKHDSYIFHEDNDFEVFIDPDGTNHNYVELEMNALNTTWDLLLTKPYRDKGAAVDAFEIEGLKTAVHVDGTLSDPRDTDKGWTIEIAIPWNAMAKLSKQPIPPRDGVQWRVNFSRVEWLYEIADGKYRRAKNPRENNWVWSPQGTINMHQPERWGYVQFTTAPPGEAVLQPDPAGPAKHLLHRIYEAQVEFRKDNERYAANLAELGLEDLTHPSLAGPPQMVVRDGGYHATASVRWPSGEIQRWRIREDSLMVPISDDK